MLSMFDPYQKVLIAAYRALADAEPPSRAELRELPQSLNARTVEHLRPALRELSRSAGVHIGNSDWGSSGHLLPRQRQVRVTKSR
ncbi:hypothetical protein PBI_GAIA_74 [Mycobacterium phage Gaia]|uniref:Uncharacterized protein n=1 Tax=Mycobacterium phage Gaia TaxID=1486472 RepID=A0A068F3H6_9CAUD|nr:hypothetical protein VC46_gp159 [Mycobacterium phage Gaia]AID58893.1 hypothetical protein PBI_GAIA_74 [Mycobacterium phage Gaia]AYR00012.1 hypothetical protein PBI_NEBKISS_73 [Mycobacterium phage Nebkiss]